MNSLVNRVLSEMEFTPKTEIETYKSGDIVIFRPEFTVKRQAAFSSFHLILPMCSMPLTIDNKSYVLEKGKLLCVNPSQYLKNITEGPVDAYLAIFIDKSFVDHIVQEACGKPRIWFANDNFQIDADLIGLLRRFAYEYANKQLGYEFLLQCLSSQLVTYVLRYVDSNISSNHRKHDFSRRKDIDKAIEYIRTYYDESISLDEMASIANLSPYHFIKVFQAQTGKTPYDYLLDVKIAAAKDLLKSRQYRVVDIGMKCGFSNPSHFSTVFKKKTGLSPTQYQKTNPTTQIFIP